MNNDVILQGLQAGLEATRGTSVAATRKVYAKATQALARQLQTFEDTTQTYEADRRANYARQRPSFTFQDIATFEDLSWWMQMGAKGGVTATGDGGIPPAYPYIFVPSLATDDLKSMTLEFNHTGNVYKATQVMLNQWTLRADSDKDDEPAWMFEGQAIARDWATSTFTGSLTDRTTEPILARGSKLYIDAAGGTIGTTQVTARLIAWTMTVQNGLNFKAYAEDEQAMSANKVSRSARRMSAQITLEFDSDAEFVNYRSNTPVQRLIRLERDGPTLIHSTPTTNKRLRVDMYGYWSAVSFGERLASRILTLSFQPYFDATAQKSWSVEVVNALSTLP